MLCRMRLGISRTRKCCIIERDGSVDGAGGKVRKHCPDLEHLAEYAMLIFSHHGSIECLAYLVISNFYFSLMSDLGPKDAYI